MNSDTQCTEALRSKDIRSAVQCGGCGYEWKVTSSIEGLTAKMCLVCGSVTVRTKKNSSKDSF